MGNIGKARKPFLLRVLLFGAVFSAILAYATQFFPDPARPWLSFNQNRGEEDMPDSRDKGLGDKEKSKAYYAAITAPPGFAVGAPRTFAEWETQYFSKMDFVGAKYYNSGDLGFGRDMNCNDDGIRYLACYVVNHGFGPGGPPESSVDDAIEKKNTLARVAMVFDRNNDGNANDVTFYVYDEKGMRLDKVPLDSEVDRDKFVPHLCLTCHGGKYDDNKNTVTGANFLPFDLTAFEYSKRHPEFSQAKQETAFKRPQ